MRAAYIDHTGPPGNIRVGDLPIPDLRPGQVLVRVHAVAVNPIDTYLRSGVVKAELPRPYILGSDLAGVVERVTDGVGQFRAGDRVWCSNQGLAGRQGTFAEFCAVDQQWLYALPVGVSFESAAACALVGITAHLGLFLHARLQPGEVVFVNGGTGGVGSSVVQLAKAAGAVVITSAGSDEKAEQCRQLGAEHVILYRTENVEERLQQIVQATGPVHVWFETLRQPTLDRTIPVMAKRGRIVLMAGRDARPEFPVGPFYVKDLRALGFAMFNASADEQRMAADEINRLLATGQLMPLIGKVMSLTEAAAAHELQESNTLHGAGSLSGKIVLNP